MFGWEPGEATIVAKAPKGDGIGNWAPNPGIAVVFSFVADVRLDDGTPVFRAHLEEPLVMTSFRAPSVGDTVRVHANAHKRKARFDLSDPTVSYDADSKRQRHAHQKALEDVFDQGPDQS